MWFEQFAIVLKVGSTKLVIAVRGAPGLAMLSALRARYSRMVCFYGHSPVLRTQAFIGLRVVT